MLRLFVLASLLCICSTFAAAETITVVPINGSFTHSGNVPSQGFQDRARYFVIGGLQGSLLQVTVTTTFHPIFDPPDVALRLFDSMGVLLVDVHARNPSFSFTFPADQTYLLLLTPFHSNDPFNFTITITGISPVVTPLAVPEPVSIILLATGLAAIGIKKKFYSS